MRVRPFVVAFFVLAWIACARPIIGQGEDASPTNIETLASPALLINEVMASNSGTAKDPQGQYDDWVELYNAGTSAVDAGGLYLTDNPDDPTQWQIPLGRPAETTVAPGGFLLIWLDGDTDDAGLHAGFKLSAAGDRIALFDTDGATVLDRVEFDEQVPDVSYGRNPDQLEDWRYMGLPTPRARNIVTYSGRVAGIAFSHERGFYAEPFFVAVTTPTTGAAVYYTLDGTSPFDLKLGLPTGVLYTGPIPISTTTCLRAVAHKPGCLPTNIITHTYIFLDDVINQATDPQSKAQVTPDGCPTSWGNGATGDYQMDPDVVGQNGTDLFSGLYASTIRDDLKAAPTISLVMPIDDWFGSKGIYINQSQDGTERVASFEYIDPATGETIQANCAIAMQGGVSGGGTSLDRWKTFKLSMRPRFKTETDDGTPTGGPSKLDFSFFPDSPVQQCNTLVLDGVLNHSWLHATDSGQRDTATYIQDQYVADLHNVIGGHSPHGAYAHIYLNGLYWGMYYIHERPDHAWAAEIFGGDEDEYDAIKHDAGNVINSGTGGNARTNYNALLAAANAVAASPTDASKYQSLCNLLDVDDYIAYLLANWYAGNHDWPHKNWYATHRNTTDGKWRFHSWDAEHTVEGGNDVGESPDGIHAKLAPNADYRMRFADIVHRCFFHNGPLTYPAAADLYQARMDQIDRAIVGESARWGDNRRTLPYTRQDWLKTQNNKLTGFFPTRSNQVLGWLKSANLYPAVAAPEFYVDGAAQHGGYATTGAALSMTAGAGDIWYTLDGTDPRESETAAQQIETVTLVGEKASKRVLVPTGPIDNAWRTDPAFNDSAWQAGMGGVGYELSSGYEPYFSIDVETSMASKNATCYIRIPFTLTPTMLEGLDTLTLNVRYDDGFIAYLNGTELQRALFNGTPTWNSAASANHSDSLAKVFESFDLSSRIRDLNAGINLLAIHGMNLTVNDSDFLISVELLGGKKPQDTEVSNVVRYTDPIALSASVCVKSRALSNGVWSALNEAVFAVGPVAESLRISEIMYHPADTGNPDDPNAEFIELTNIGNETINLNLVRFTKGIDHTFARSELPAGGYCLLVKDIVAFEARYGAGLPVVGRYAGSLNNAGETIELVDAAGEVIQRFRYEDDWFDLTDGDGFSLTVRDPQTATDLNDPTAWRSSVYPGGSPGTSDTAKTLVESGAVVINELLANSSGVGPDWIELHNTTSEAIDIGDWYLSDDVDDLTKYRIASGTSLPADGYLVFSENEHFGNPDDPGCTTPFGLSKDGETLYLLSGSDGLLTGYLERQKFGASEAGVTLGRWQVGEGEYDFVALTEPTPGRTNASPVVAWGTGSLANGTGTLQLNRPGATDEKGEFKWIRADRIAYSDGSHPQGFAQGIDPWPVEADGSGLSLTQIDPAAYGNNPGNWKAATPSPGQ
ncbi:MAG TPA: lamin tail domain-containing protein [Sedimentisphaerales bacterium]|jgi:hypothetical protein|nr:lamin tail domain-containing protein [Sedimentisphaerales bacterium]HNU29966.1 lamin tail domain-containing protein [Sedimentisphaerales bacterium]